MVTRIITCFFAFFIVFSTMAQDLACRTKPTKKQLELLKDFNPLRMRSARVADGTVTNIAIVAHIIRQSDGTGGLTEQQLTDAMANVNDFYINSDLSFFVLLINYIDNDQYFNFHGDDENELTSSNNIENTINIYFANSVGDDQGAYCGYAYFPGGPDVILMDNSCTINGSTLPHEIGHFFTLHHTHGKVNGQLTDELVTRLSEEGANCETAGDELCDTPADPQLGSDNVSGNVTCQYNGTDIDANGDEFDPDVNNIMSYSLWGCRDRFSTGQYDRMAAAYTSFRSYLTTQDYLALFDVEDKQICAGESITFENKSVGATSYEWVFEGGVPPTSTDENPTVTYNTSGQYNVTLTITTSDAETDIKEVTDYVDVRDEITSEITQKSGGFEETVLTEEVLNEDASFTFEKTDVVSTEGNSSMYIEMFNYQVVGQEDYLVIGALNTSEEKTFEMQFDYSYAAYSASYTDGLAIVHRDPCGEWITAWEASGAELQTTSGFVTEAFVPQANEWATEVVVFEIPSDNDVTEVAFKSINGWGNNLYIDNYNLYVSGQNFDILSTEVTNATCPDTPDGSIAVTAVGQQLTYSIDGENYIESNELTGLAAGEYEVFVQNSVGTIISEIVTVGSVNEYPDIPIIEFINDTFSVSVDVGQTVQWYFNGNLIVDETASSLSMSERGSYEVEVFNGDCGSLSEPYLILSVDLVENSLDLFPNPAYSTLNIQLPNDLRSLVDHVKIMDLSGRVLHQSVFQSSFNIADYRSGLYLIELVGEDYTVRKRFLKR